MIVNKRFDDPDKRQEDDPQDAKDVFRDKLLTSSQIEEHKVLAQHSIKR